MKHKTISLTYAIVDDNKMKYVNQYYFDSNAVFLLNAMVTRDFFNLRFILYLN